MSQWFYLGCHQGVGHYVFAEGMRRHSERNSRGLNCFDGLLPPQVSALAFWDYSVDKRGGSNSAFFAPSLTIGGDELLQEAMRRFPDVFARLPKKVVLLTQHPQ